MDNRAVLSWVWYDWANSAFATTVMAAVMPVFYSSVAAQGLEASDATAYWGYTQSIALIFVVLLAPILGAIADRTHSKKKFLRFFTYLGVVATLLMGTIGSGDWLWASILVILGTVAFSSGNVFYDAFLPDLVPEEKRDMVSSRGFALGYLGGGILLALNIALIMMHDLIGITQTAATQICFVSVGVWWFVFSIPFFRYVPEKNDKEQPKAFYIYAKIGFNSVFQTLRQIKQYPELLKFLIAFLFYSDGINTIIKMATVYGVEIGIGQTDLITALLITQFVGLPCTLLFGKMASRLGSKPSLILSLFIYLIIVILGHFMSTALHFYLLAILVGFVQGGSQALSRSIYTRLVPQEKSAEFFGFYSLSGKFASIFGPAIFGMVSQITGTSRYGIVALALFFIIGIIGLMMVNLEKGKKEAQSNI